MRFRLKFLMVGLGLDWEKSEPGNQVVPQTEKILISMKMGLFLGYSQVI